jgi:hypothetical protein
MAEDGTRSRSVFSYVSALKAAIFSRLRLGTYYFFSLYWGPAILNALRGEGPRIQALIDG